MSIFSLVNQDETISLEDFQISHEMIAPQLGDPIVAQLEKEIENIQTFIAKRKIKSSQHEKCMRDTEYKSYIENIEKIISNRFGFKVKIFDGGAIGTPAACLPIPPKEFNVLGQRINSDVQEQLEKEKARAKSKEEYEAFSDYDFRVQYQAWDTAVNSFKAMNDVMNTKGFKVDLNKAKISGLPDTYIVDLIFNFAELINNFGLTTRELVAIILHEVGHGFTHLESSYRHLSNTTVLLDTFLYNLNTKNKSHRESFNIAYKKVTDDKSIDKLKDKNALTFYIITGDRLLDFMSNTSSPHYSVDSEQQADQFSGRFGLGQELASALSKIMSSTTGYLAMSLYAVISITCIVLSVLVPFLIYLFGPLAFVFTIVLYTSIFKKNNVYYTYTYDDDKQRLQRIRNEAVRLLRTSSLDKETVDNLLENIKNLDYIVDQMREGMVGPIDKIYQTIFPGGRRKLELRNIEQTIEKLIENDLHIAKHKINQITK